MDLNDKIKILNEGFTIIRSRNIQTVGMDQSKPHIMAMTKRQPQWHILEKGFKSKAARDRRMKELKKNLKIIEG